MRKKLHIYVFIVSFFVVLINLLGCQKTNGEIGNTTDSIKIDSLVASLYTVKAWDTTTITCYATGDTISYSWECDHGNFNGNGHQIRYAAGECCVGVNTITCEVSNIQGYVKDTVKIKVTSYFDD